MPVVHPVIRPPGEADSFLLQVTTGCSCNSCSFCGAYRNKKFSYKPLPEIMEDIRQWSLLMPDTSKVFLMDGDAMVLKSGKLAEILDELGRVFPKLRRVSAYANDFNILQKTEDELRALSAGKLRLIYMGLESGSQEILDSCGKKSTVEGMISAVRKAETCGIKSSVIALLGLGGREGSRIHAEQTAVVLNRMQPAQLSLLSLMLVPGTELHKKAEEGSFSLPDAAGLLAEMYQIIENLDLKKTIFHSNHASNYLPLSGRLPQDKDRFLEAIGYAMRKPGILREEWMRGL